MVEMVEMTMCIPYKGYTWIHPTSTDQGATITNQWLTALLVDKGVLSEHGLTRNAAIRTCRTCRTQCLAGININGLDTWLDPRQLHPAGELHALLDNRPTFSLYAGKQLVPRDQHWIKAYPAGRSQRPTFATHRCGHPTPTNWTITTPQTTQQTLPTF